MEKLVYLLWNPSEPPSQRRSSSARDAFRDRLLSALPLALRERGADSLKISATDSAVSAGAELHLGPHCPDALVSFWLECAHERADCEALLAQYSPDRAGYLVAESQPLRVRAAPDEVGRRMPGFSLVGCIEPAEGLSHAAFIRRWETVHRDVAIATQSTFSYVRNEVVRPLTDDAPAWAGIVEEGFPVEALADRHVFFDAAGSEQRYRENARRMVESCRAFIALDRVDSHPMSEYRFF